ncbi:hypothetical protein [Haloarcula marismortui]|uniref:Uncharacterized protein n=1 Tax=Haloarcula marismortui ATCC 33800 TaxID=662476 RepID=M0JY78_9EURY|nr:hypothetical protein [Haloarcula sinaiiensis]EMA13946.1 hypothetical protein C436_08402 [Haloarcula sinaiiensis ATCC 33800]QUJ73112.1 hypothetical protein KDQ40_05010 [Haloarcula sinaiiensis ATCC 33800]
MVISTEPAWDDAVDQFVKDYENAIVYADIDQETVLHEGAVRVLANGWVELPTGRLLSPDAVHHIDTQMAGKTDS